MSSRESDRGCIWPLRHGLRLRRPIQASCVQGAIAQLSAFPFSLSHTHSRLTTRGFSGFHTSQSLPVFHSHLTAQPHPSTHQELNPGLEAAWPACWIVLGDKAPTKHASIRALRVRYSVWLIGHWIFIMQTKGMLTPKSSTRRDTHLLPFVNFCTGSSSLSVYRCSGMHYVAPRSAPCKACATGSDERFGESRSTEGWSAANVFRAVSGLVFSGSSPRCRPQSA